MSVANTSKIKPLSENLTTFTTKVKYYFTTDSDGNTVKRLASIQSFNLPKFKPSGWEEIKDDSTKIDSLEDLPVDIISDVAANIERARRRAKTNAFDIIMCNSDLDLFCTFTYSPENIGDKSSYDECYKVLAPWLSNRVQRKDLKYVCVPEYTQKGDIHFHAIMNSSALKNKLSVAINPHNNLPLKHKGNTLYNITDWRHGFTSCEFIRNRNQEENGREAVSKYIFKYMGKNEGAKIGGRYCLIGGDLIRPKFEYCNDLSEINADFDLSAAHHKHFSLGDNLVFNEWSFI